MVHPLLCWDIVQEACYQRVKHKVDLNAIAAIQSQNNWHQFAILPEAALLWENKVILITNDRLNIEHATQNLYAMNGYKPKDVIGYSPKMFQGKATSLLTRGYIKSAIEKQEPFQTSIANYRKDGSIYLCKIEGYPVFNQKGTLVNFVAFEEAA